MPNLTFTNVVDDAGRPAGGSIEGVGIKINFQHGPLVDAAGVRQEPNGAFVEDLIEGAIQRLEHFQTTGFACAENANAVRDLREALADLGERTRRRVERGVEGSHTV